jgi:3-oxoacyl-[acyl-carrier protein] reductase
MPPTTDRPLTGRTVFVAGAAGTIGDVVATSLAAQGADLVLHGHDRSPAVADLATHLTRRHGVRTFTVHGDVTESGQLAQVRDTLLANAIDGLDGLVNCTTGFDGRPVGPADLSVKEFRRVVDVDLVGSYVLVHELLPLLTARGARVVLFSSLAAQRGRPGAAHLCAAKAGVRGLALGLARDLEPHGVTLHVLAPGPVGAHGGPTGVPVSTPDQVAAVVAVLSSAAGDPLRGQVIELQGNPRITEEAPR